MNACSSFFRIPQLFLASALLMMGGSLQAQWNQQTSGTSETLHGVHLADGARGWAVGANGTVLYTSDGGSTWSSQSPGVSVPLYDVNTEDPNTSWIVGGSSQSGTFTYTTDGGNNWNAPSSLSVPYEFSSVFFIDAQEGWFVGDGGTIYHSTDGGSTWTDQSTGSSALNSIYFDDPPFGWIAGDGGTVLTTGSGGASWTTGTTPVNEDLHSIHFEDLTHGWAVGANGTIIYTDVGGGSWSSQSSPVSVDLYGVHFIDADTGWAVGDNGTVLRTNDGGVSWNSEASNTNEDLRAVHFPQDTLGWAVGTNGEIIHRGGACQSTSSSISPTACISYTVPSGDETYTASGNYEDTLTNVVGCDSIISIDLTIDSVDTAVVSVSPTELEAQASGASYQWLNCDSGYAEISGETSQNFETLTPGKYAVEVSENGCTDTSSCHETHPMGLQENAFERELRLSPNPTRGQLRIRLGELSESLTLRVMDVNGRLLSSQHYDASRRIHYDLQQEPGLYLLEIEDARGRKALFKVVKE